MDKEIFNKESNIRLDSFLSNKVDALSRTKLKKLIQNGNITVDNYVVKPSYVLKGGESISIKYVPRDVYNQIFLNKIIPENKKEEKKNNDDLNTIRTVQY